jgi:hypothetical protein
MITKHLSIVKLAEAPGRLFRMENMLLTEDLLLKASK